MFSNTAPDAKKERKLVICVTCIHYIQGRIQGEGGGFGCL